MRFAERQPGPRRGLVFWFATWFGAGLSPVGPGTVATLAALPVYFAMVPLPSLVQLAIVLVINVAGCYAAQRIAIETGTDDPQIVVIDESGGILLALWIAVPSGWLGVLAATLLFRLLDIYKPGPIRLVERLRPPGLGIMADDLLAGIVAGLLVRLVL